MHLPNLFIVAALAATSVASPNEASKPTATSLLPPHPLTSTLLNPGFCAVPNGSIEDACGATYEAVEYTNHRVRPIIQNLVKTDFFRFYYLDLFGDSCPLGDDSGTCGNRACAVDTVEDEADLPDIWRASNLGKLSKDTVSSNNKLGDIQDDIELSCVKNADDSLAQGGRLQRHADAAWDESCTDKNYCVPEDDRTGPEGVYVSLLDNPERYTGYNGPHAHMIWRNVYQQNCFGYTGPSLSKSFMDGEEFPSSESSSAIDVASEVPTEDASLKYLTEDATDVGKDQEMCIEQRLFYRLISGMHSSVSTHLCYSYLDKNTGEWGPDLSCFLARVGNHPERLSNLYFNYAVVSRALAKLFKYVDDLQFCPNSKDYDQSTRRQILQLSRSASTSPEIFDETKVFSTPEAKILKEEFRQRFHEVSALMDCVGCDRCRLWGKLQAAGYGTALKIVFELNEEEDEQSRKLIASLRRSELVSLVNTFDRLSKSIEAVEYFRNLVRDQLKEQGVDVDSLSSKNTPEKKQSKKEEEYIEDDGADLYEYYDSDDESNTNTKQQSARSSIWDDPEWELWKDAFKFIFQSYIDFPKNVYNLFLINTNHYWNVLVGRDAQMVKDQVVRGGQLESLNADL